MAHLEIIIDSNSPEEKEVFESWLKQWEHGLCSISPNKGCGCCVDIFTVEITEEAIADFNKRFEEIYKTFIDDARKNARAERNARRKAAKTNKAK